MQVTCPNCGARYAVDPLAIGPVGRIVQCARCSHRWLQTVASSADSAARDAVDAAMNAPQTAPRASSHPFETDRSMPSLGPAIPMPPIEPIPDFVIRPPRQRNSLPAVIAPRPGWKPSAGTVASLAALVVVIALAVVIYIFREAVVEHLPTAWRTMLRIGT